MKWFERVGRRIKLRDLHVLLAVVQSGSLAKAAEDLAISTPVVSKVIADLERTLGVKLLDRDRHGATPTIFGAALLKSGVAVFDDYGRFNDDLNVAARVPFEVGLRFRRTPLELYFEIALKMTFIDSEPNDHPFVDLDGGIGLRFYL